MCISHEHNVSHPHYSTVFPCVLFLVIPDLVIQETSNLLSDTIYIFPLLKLCINRILQHIVFCLWHLNSLYCLYLGGIDLHYRMHQFEPIWSHHFMANRWGNSGTSGWVYFWHSKITADGDCNHEIKRHWLLGRKVMTNLDSILKSRDITLPTEVRLVKAMVFPVVMYGCESWTVKKAEARRIDAFELWYWRRLLRVPWTARRFSHSS